MKKAVSKTQLKNQRPFISVVIPAYNEEKYLPVALKALKKQTYPKDRFEIIVVDNNSKDRTPTIAKTAGARVINEKMQGHVFALNAGMQKAKGEIIASTDADTEVQKNWLEVLEKVFTDKEVVAVTGSAYYASDSKVKQIFGKALYDMFLKFHFSVGRPSLSGINLAVRRDAFHQIHGLDTRYKIFGDVELGLRMKKIGKVKYCKELAVVTSPRRWKKGSLEDYYKYFNSYVKTVWFYQPPPGSLTPRR